MSHEFDPDRYAKYASLDEPKKHFGNHELIDHSKQTLTVQEFYPKAKYHYILIPRVGEAPRVPQNLKNIRSLLSLRGFSRAQAFALLKDMERDALKVKAMIEEEMASNGFKWDIWIGFHVAPSYRYAIVLNTPNHRH